MQILQPDRPDKMEHDSLLYLFKCTYGESVSKRSTHLLEEFLIGFLVSNPHLNLPLIISIDFHVKGLRFAMCLNGFLQQLLSFSSPNLTVSRIESNYTRAFMILIELKFVMSHFPGLD